MKRSLVTLLVLGIASVGFAAPAAAYDRDAYEYAAGHMIGYKDIPKSLAAKKGANFNASPASGKSFLCSDSEKLVQYSGGDHQFSINYPGGKKSSGISVDVTQYSSDAKALRAFNELKKGLDRCAGPSSGQETYDSDTEPQVDTWSRLVTTGVVPLVTVAGVQSVFLNENYEDVTTGPGAGTYSSDGYNVYTLVNDVIINTSYYTGSELNLSTKERRNINQVAFNAVTRWLD